MVFKQLRNAQLYLSRDKVDLYSQSMDCLGHIISDVGIHADTDKMQKIRDWRQPRKLPRDSTIPWTRTIPGALSARYYLLHNTIVVVYPQWETIRLDSIDE